MANKRALSTTAKAARKKKADRKTAAPAGVKKARARVQRPAKKTIGKPGEKWRYTTAWIDPDENALLERLSRVLFGGVLMDAVENALVELILSGNGPELKPSLRRAGAYLDGTARRSTWAAATIDLRGSLVQLPMPGPHTDVHEDLSTMETYAWLLFQVLAGPQRAGSYLRQFVVTDASFVRLARALVVFPHKDTRSDALPQRALHTERGNPVRAVDSQEGRVLRIRLSQALADAAAREVDARQLPSFSALVRLAVVEKAERVGLQHARAVAPRFRDYPSPQLLFLQPNLEEAFCAMHRAITVLVQKLAQQRVPRAEVEPLVLAFDELFVALRRA